MHLKCRSEKSHWLYLSSTYGSSTSVLELNYVGLRFFNMFFWGTIELQAKQVKCSLFFSNAAFSIKFDFKWGFNWALKQTFPARNTVLPLLSSFWKILAAWLLHRQTHKRKYFLSDRAGTSTDQVHQKSPSTSFFWIETKKDRRVTVQKRQCGLSSLPPFLNIYIYIFLNMQL